MKLKLSVDRGLGKFIDFQITADATATVSDIADALVSASPASNSSLEGNQTETSNLPKAGKVTLRIVPTPTGGFTSKHQSGRIIAPGTNLIDSGIRSGLSVQVVTIGTNLQQNQSKLAGQLKIIDGPEKGTEFQLMFGSQTIGRTDTCDVFIKDESVSKMHASIIMSDVTEILDHNSANGVMVGTNRVTRTRIGPGDVVRLGDTAFIVNQTSKPSLEDATTTDISFIASPQLIVRPQEEEYELPSAPSEPNAPRFPIISLAGPLLMGTAMFLMTRSPMSLIFVALSPILMIGNYIDQLLQTRRQTKAAINKAETEIKFTNQDLAKKTEAIRENLLHAYPPVEQAWNSALNQGPYLWWRRPENPEFLQIRLGLGTIPTPLKLSEAKNEGLPQFVTLIKELREFYSVVPNAPVVANLRIHGNLGFCGDERLTEEVLLAAVAQLICMHSPAHVTIAAFTNKRRLHNWMWLQWLPHTDNPHSPIGDGLLAHDGMSSSILIDKLEGLVEQRTGKDESSLDPTSKNYRGPLAKDTKADQPLGSEIIVIVDNPTADISRLIRLTEIGPDVGIHFIWQSHNAADLPAACRIYMQVDSSGCRVVDVRKGLVIQPVISEAMKAAQADQVARVLAPVVDGGTPINDDSDLPTSLSTITLLGKEVAEDPDAVISRWHSSNSIIDRFGDIVPIKRAISLNGLVGHNGREYFGLDIREHGPHALIGGTTGSGKSEFLQTWILGMAANVSPDRLTFLFMDYKGGAAFGRCEELPHSVGLVTDLTNNILLRAAKSLKAELVRREELLQKYKFTDLVSFEKSGHPEAPPSLLLVIDEFAALKAQFEEFMKDIVDIGQRGRSLGVHLIMATQRPAGIINDNLRANTNLRIALRMNDASDSVDVIGDKQAAFINPKNAGRGAARLGPSRIINFQSGFPGAITPDESTIPPVHITPLGFGINEPWEVRRQAVDLSGYKKDIDRIINNLTAAAKKANIPKPRPPWLPALKEVYDVLELKPRTDAQLVLGMADYPELQKQEKIFFEPEERAHIGFFGSSGSGKTTALRSLAIAASITPKSGPVHIYGLDYAGGGLSVLADLPNVGNILDANDTERVQRLFTWLGEELDARSTLFTSVMASSLSDYRKLANKPDYPRLLILIDNTIAFHETHDMNALQNLVPKVFRKILLEGHSYGIHVAMAGAKPGIPTSLLTYIQRQVILRQSDPTEYTNYNLKSDVLGDDAPPGRGIIRVDGDEVQLAAVGKITEEQNGSLIERAPTMVELAQIIQNVAEFVPPPSAEYPVKRLQILQPVIPAETIPWAKNGKVVMGISSITLEPEFCDLHDPIIITGGRGSGVSTAMKYLANAIRHVGDHIEFIYFGKNTNEVGLIENLWDMRPREEAQMEESIDQLLKHVNFPSSTGRRYALFVEDFLSFEGASYETKLINVIKKMRENGHIVVASEENGKLEKAFGVYPSAYKPFKNLMFLQGTSLQMNSLLTSSTCPKFPKLTQPGRGLWVSNNDITVVQMPFI